MIHSEQTAFETLCARVVPVPKQAKQLEQPGLTISALSAIDLTAPEAEFGPIKTAGEKIRKLFADHCGENCFGAADGAVKVTLQLGDAPVAMPIPEEGYFLRVSRTGIDITGFGPTGLLYGVITLSQLCVWDNDGVELPALEILDWPENPFRGIKAECRYGTNVMEREDWLDMLEEMAAKKMNYVEIALYGCWIVQYDGRVSEYLYMPVKNRPELKTPMVVRYYSPEQGCWIDCEKLPPLFENNLLDEVFRCARDLGMKVCPTWNSLGHNTLVPAMIPEISAKNEDGTPTLTGFCTSNPATYEFLFSVYDQIIDDYMIPYGMDVFNAVLDEVHTGVGMNADDPLKNRSPWCSCPACRDKDKGDIFIEHAIKLIAHLKERGMKSVVIACDMLLATRRQSLGWLGDRLMEAVEKAGLKDTLLIAWWTYFDIKEKMYFDNLHPELGLRAFTTPWTGYYHWCLLTNPLRDIQLLAEMNHRDGGEGTRGYAMWEQSYDRNHDALAEYAWGYEQTGTVQDVTDRYVLRHFAARAEEAQRAFKLMDLASEERMEELKDPLRRVISNFNLMLYKLSYYFFSYVREGKPYPRNFPGEGLESLMSMRDDCERALYTISAMAGQAAEIFRSIAQDSRCNRKQADIFAYECENYVCLVEDWLAMLRMQDLCQAGQYKAVAPVAHKRYEARLTLMTRCEQVKKKFARECLTMRDQSIFLQLFADITAYVEGRENPVLDMMDLSNVVGQRFWSLR